MRTITQQQQERSGKDVGGIKVIQFRKILGQGRSYLKKKWAYPKDPRRGGYKQMI